MSFLPLNDEGSPLASPAGLSKRAARRLIQRAFVLTGRDRQVRQHIREVHIIVLWRLDDWDLEWTVTLDRGRIEFDRRPSKRPDMILTWKSAVDFFMQAETERFHEESIEREGEIAVWRTVSPLVRAFFPNLGGVMRNPVDENGVRLV
jgi:hypothetical protein